MAKFYFFEKIVSLFYTHVFTAPKETYSKPTQLGVTFASGYLAGVVCAVVSHPADSLVSQMGKAENRGKGFGQIVSEVGFGNLATKGLGTRVVMIGTLTGKLKRAPISPTECRANQITNRLPVVDLRLLQGVHGHGHDRWQVNTQNVHIDVSSLVGRYTALVGGLVVPYSIICASGQWILFPLPSLVQA